MKKQLDRNLQLLTSKLIAPIVVNILVALTPALGAPGDVASQRESSLPAEWSYLPELGESTIFDVIRTPPGFGPVRQLRAQTHNNVGILQTVIDIDLTESITLQWNWKIEQLPSQLPENISANHDYFSIAVKFDNGQDLTYMWSESMPIETAFRCPLKNWTHRETHVVVESGNQHLKEWRFEERSIQRDYEKYIGGALPKRITHIWLIANSSIRHGEGIASFGEISIGDGNPKNGRNQIF